MITVSSATPRSVWARGVEEGLGVAHAPASSPDEVGKGQIVEVPLVDEPAGLVVVAQEGVKVRDVLY